MCDENNNNNNCFDRSGLAALSDLKTPEWSKVFNILESDQKIFLSKGKYFRSTEYKWPHDSLHNWSRVWEYPYIYYHLWQRRSKLEKKNYAISYVVDFGSGVTFFPFSVARMNYNVTCVDIDPICRKDLAEASKHISQLPGKVNFRLTGKGTTTLPFPDNEIDIVYCISVLEHIHDFENAISEIVRIIKPKGLLLLTIDIDMYGNREMGIESYKKLMVALKRDFTFLYPVATIHPSDMLTSASGPYPYKRRPSFLTVEGMVLEKKIEERGEN